MLGETIVPEHLMYALDRRRTEESQQIVSRPLANIQGFVIDLPVKPDGSFDVDARRELATRFYRLQERRATLRKATAELDAVIGPYLQQRAGIRKTSAKLNRRCLACLLHSIGYSAGWDGARRRDGTAHKPPARAKLRCPAQHPSRHPDRGFARTAGRAQVVLKADSYETQHWTVYCGGVLASRQCFGPMWSWRCAGSGRRNQSSCRDLARRASRPAGAAGVDGAGHHRRSGAPLQPHANFPEMAEPQLCSTSGFVQRAARRKQLRADPRLISRKFVRVFAAVVLTNSSPSITSWPAAGRSGDSAWDMASAGGRTFPASIRSRPASDRSPAPSLRLLQAGLLQLPC